MSFFKVYETKSSQDGVDTAARRNQCSVPRLLWYPSVNTQSSPPPPRKKQAERQKPGDRVIWIIPSSLTQFSFNMLENCDRKLLLSRGCYIPNRRRLGKRKAFVETARVPRAALPRVRSAAAAIGRVTGSSLFFFYERCVRQTVVLIWSCTPKKVGKREYKGGTHTHTNTHTQKKN